MNLNIHKYERIIDTAEKFIQKNPILKKDTLAIESDTNKFKKGNGITEYKDLPYLNGNGSNDGSSVVEKDINIMGVTVGNYKDGDIIKEGTTFTEVLIKMMQKQIVPVYKAPTISFTISPKTAQENNKEVTFTISPSFVKNDAGNFEKCEIYRNGTLITTLTSLTDYNDKIVPTTDITYKVIIYYKEGIIKKDNFGKDYPTGHIIAGSKEASKNINIVYPYYYGMISDINSVDIKDLTKDITIKENKDYVYNGIDKYAIILYNKEYGKLTSILDGNGFECISGYSYKEISINNIDYIMYYTNDKATLEDFHYIFKY